MYFFTLLILLFLMLVIPWSIYIRSLGKKKKQRYMADVLDAGITSFGYKDIPDDPRLSEYKDMFELEDELVNRALAHQSMDEEFEDAKLDLFPGNYVKLKFVIFVEEEFGTWKETVAADEELWVMVEECECPLFYGTLATEPQTTEAALKIGQQLWFHSNHIMAIR